MLEPGQPVVVRLRRDGREKLAYPMTVTHDDGDHVIVEGTFAGDIDRDLGYATFMRTDHFVEHYWRTRWYSVKDVRTAGGARKGWYCDVCRPALVSAGVIVSDDLHLDVWVPGDGSAPLVLDEDEFTASGLEGADPDAARHARGAVAELLRAARARDGVFAS